MESVKKTSESQTSALHERVTGADQSHIRPTFSVDPKGLFNPGKLYPSFSKDDHN
jgi:hypothetical protein